MQVEQLLTGTPMPRVSPLSHQHCPPAQPQKFCRGNIIEKNVAAPASTNTVCCCLCQSSVLVCLKESVRSVLL